jgi:tRNA U34 2-thiouridine synthase MnmA/TrmU
VLAGVDKSPPHTHHSSCVALHPQAQLSRVMFPLAPLTKGGVRALAAAAQLPNQARRDSQGICFLGKVKFNEI